jgi:hypothetical protein
VITFVDRRTVEALHWPPLPLSEWEETYDTLHMWTQILGKTRLVLSPMQNHYWQTALYVSTRGLTTSPMPYDHGLLEIELDFVTHELFARTSNGVILESFPLVPMTVAEFYDRYIHVLRSAGVNLHISAIPQEVSDRTPFQLDRKHRSYDREAVHRLWRILREADRLFKEFRGEYLGKSSPVNFWWGSFDLAETRFSGRRAPMHPGGVPYISDRVVREAYSHECTSVGWWPGGGPSSDREHAVLEPAFYAYAYPEPKGFSTAAIEPKQAYYHPTMYEWILPYEAVREAREPDAMVRAFCETTYDAAATLGNWDRAAIERPRVTARRTRHELARSDATRH